MIKYLASAVFAFLITLMPAAAAPSKKIFAGSYNGNSAIENNVGDSVFYGPIRFKITKTGKITGTAYNTDTKKLLKVTGKINKVNSKFGILFTGKASGTFSDGAKWKVEITAQKGLSAKVIQGKTTRRSYTGSLSLTNL